MPGPAPSTHPTSTTTVRPYGPVCALRYHSDPFQNARRIVEEEAAAAIVEREKAVRERERARANERATVPSVWGSVREAVHEHTLRIGGGVCRSTWRKER